MAVCAQQCCKPVAASIDHALHAGCVWPWVSQEYNYHLGAVNTVTFIDDARRFVSSSDDKSLRVWEFGIPVQIK